MKTSIADREVTAALIYPAVRKMIFMAMDEFFEREEVAIENEPQLTKENFKKTKRSIIGVIKNVVEMFKGGEYNVGAGAAVNVSASMNG